MKIDLHDLVARSHQPDEKSSGSAKAQAGSGVNLIDAFQNILEGEMKDLVSVTQEESRLNREFAAGKVDNIHEVMTASAKAGLAMETAIQIRNLAVRGFQKLTQLR